MKISRNRVIGIMSGLDNLAYFQNHSHRSKYIRNQSARIAFSFNLISDSLNENSLVLDLGIAPYFFAHVITSLSNASVCGVGLSTPVRQERMEENFGIHTYYCNMETERLPFNDSMFDMVVFTEVLEHLLMSPSHTFSEIHRVLKNRGILLVSTPNAVSLMHRLALLFGHNIFAKYSLDHTYGRHNRLFTRRELEELLLAHNFEVEKSLMFSDPRRLKNQLAKFLVFLGSKINPNLRETIIIVARAFGDTRKVFPQTIYRGSLKTD